MKKERRCNKLIDKDRIVAEIKRRFDEYSSSILKHYDACKEAKAQELGKILTILDTLEVKEVDLDKETTHYLLYEHRSPLNEITHQVGLKAEMQYHKDIENAYKAGFELGLKAQKGEEV